MRYTLGLMVALMCFTGTAQAGLRGLLDTVVAVLPLPALDEPVATSQPPTMTDCPSGYGDADGDGVISGEAGDDEGGVDLGGGVIGGVGPCTQARVVVAVVDDRINPYHAFFYPGASSVTPALRQAFGIDTQHVLILTRTGDAVADRAADAAMWAALQPGEIYWVAGTNLLLQNFAPAAQELLAREGAAAHGTAMAASVLAANPDAVVLFVGTGERRGLAEAEAAAFLHPEVDIVSTSYSASLPLIELGLPTSGFHDSLAAVLDLGKLHFAETADAPDPTTPLAAGAGPWWSIGVNGAELGTSGGTTLLSGRLTDFAADARQILPNCSVCEDGSGAVVGTGVATAQAAGVASRALFELRREWAHSDGIVMLDGVPVLAAGNGRTVSNWQLRRALEQAAAIPDIADYTLTAAIQEAVGVPVLGVAPWALVGWGTLSPDPDDQVVAQTLARFGVGTVTREKGAGFCLFQSTTMLLRRLYWNTLSPLLFGSPVPESDPYLRCS